MKLSTILKAICISLITAIICALWVVAIVGCGGGSSDDNGNIQKRVIKGVAGSNHFKAQSNTGLQLNTGECVGIQFSDYSGALMIKRP